LPEGGNNFTVCYPIPSNPTIDNIYDFPLRGVGRATINNDGSFGNIEIINSYITNTSQACISNQEQGYTNQDIDYLQTMNPQDVTTLAIGIAIYSLEVLFNIALFGLDVKSRNTKMDT